MFATIVVATDGSATAAGAVRRARALAEVHASHLHVVSAYRSSIAAAVAMGRETAPSPSDPEEWEIEVQEQVERMLGDLKRELSAAGIEVTTHAVGYDPVTAILDVAGAHHADLIVVGNKGMRGPKRVLGSVPDVVAHKATCDVLIVNTT